MIEGGAVVHEVVLPVPVEQAFRRTRIRLVHDNLPGDLGLLHDDGWSRFLARLEAVASGQDPAAYPDEQPGERLSVLRQQHDS